VSNNKTQVISSDEKEFQIDYDVAKLVQARIINIIGAVNEDLYC